MEQPPKETEEPDREIDEEDAGTADSHPPHGDATPDPAVNNEEKEPHVVEPDETDLIVPEEKTSAAGEQTKKDGPTEDLGAAAPERLSEDPDPVDIGLPPEPTSESSKEPVSAKNPAASEKESGGRSSVSEMAEGLMPDPAEKALLPPPHKMNDCWGGLTQYSTGVCCSGLCCGTTGLVGGVLSVVALFIPGSVLWYSVIGCCIGGPGIAVAPASGISGGVWLREWLGQRRGPWLWPLLAAYITEFASVALIAAAMITGTGLVALFLESIPGANPMLSDPASWIDDPDQWGWAYLGGGGGVFITGFLVGIFSAIFVPSLAGVLSYQVLGVPKSNADRRFRMPGCAQANLEMERQEKEADETVHSVKGLKMNQKQRESVKPRNPAQEKPARETEGGQPKSGGGSRLFMSKKPMVY
jgi:hypothetical protein